MVVGEMHITVSGGQGRVGEWWEADCRLPRAILETHRSHDGLRLFCNRLELSAQALERAGGLALGYSADERAAGNCPDWAKRGAELVGVIKARATVPGRAEDVFRAGARAGGPPTLPYGQLAGAAVDELPVNIEADSTEVDLLVHPVAHAWWSVVVVMQLAVNSHPIGETIWIHDDLPHLHRWDSDLN